MKIDKALTQDVKAKLKLQLSKRYPDDNIYVLDYDPEESYVLFELWEEGSGYKTYKTQYMVQDDTFVVSSKAVQVIQTYDYEEVEEKPTKPVGMFSDTEKSLTDKLVSTLDKYFGGSKQEGKPVIKQLDDEEMVAIEQMYIHVDDVDGVGDTYASPEVMEEMVKSFNRAITDGNLSANYFHKVMTDDFTVLKAWITEVDSIIGDTEVKEGTPLVKIKFNNEKAWNLRKSGELLGVSIGAIATWEEVNE